MKKTLFSLAAFSLLFSQSVSAAEELTLSDVRRIDRLIVRLVDYAEDLHDHYHEHLDGVRHTEKLDRDVTELEKIAQSLRDLSYASPVDGKYAIRLRHDTNEFLQLASRIQMTIDLVSPWVRTQRGRDGLRYMEEDAGDVMILARRIDSYLPVDTKVIDDQAAVLENCVKELYAEYREHLQGYAISRHLDADLRDLNRLVETLHSLAHNKSWNQLDLRLIAGYVDQVIAESDHIEDLLFQQTRLGFRRGDWEGVEHMHDAISDVRASAYLLQHMIDKADPRVRDPRYAPVHHAERRPHRDLHHAETTQPKATQPAQPRPEPPREVRPAIEFGKGGIRFRIVPR